MTPHRLNASARSLPFLVLLFLMAAAGCGKSVSGPAKMVPLTLRTQGGAATAIRALRAASLASSDSDTVHVDVTFTRALLVVRDVKFHTAEGDDEGDLQGGGDAENDSLGEAEGDSLGEAENDSIRTDEGGVSFRGPFVIDLLSHHGDVLDTELVPPGVYAHVQGHLQALHEGDAAATPDLSFLVGSTIDLEGTISGDGGGAFTYRARIDDEFVIHGVFTVQSDTPATAFIVFDLNRMLVDRQGRFLDPRDPANDLAIRSAIRHAIKVGLDENHDGELEPSEEGNEAGHDAASLTGF